MATKFTNHPTCIIPVAAEAEVNNYLARQGLGRCFSIPLVIGAQPELVKDSEPLVTHYGTTLVMDDAISGMINRLLARDTVRGERIEKPFQQAMTDKSGDKATSTNPYQLVIVIPVGQRAAVITALAARYADSDARFFKAGLSATGAGPATHLVDWLYAAKSFAPLLDQLITSVKRAEVFLGVLDGSEEAVRKTYDLPKYQSADAAGRSFARVWLQPKWTQAEVLKALNLKVVP